MGTCVLIGVVDLTFAIQRFIWNSLQTSNKNARIELERFKKIRGRAFDKIAAIDTWICLVEFVLTKFAIKTANLVNFVQNFDQFPASFDKLSSTKQALIAKLVNCKIH